MDIQDKDIDSSPDLLLVMGTSLRVPGVKSLVKKFANAIHQREGSNQKRTNIIYINKTPPTVEWHTVFDVHVQGSTDNWILLVLQLWKLESPGDWSGFNGPWGVSTAKGKQSKDYNDYYPPPLPHF